MASSASSRIVKTMSLFSSVRVVGIICSLIRNKLIAWLIGPAGLGLVMLYNSVIDLIGQSTRLSMDQSAQRDISRATQAESARTITVVRRWGLWLGLAGALVTCLLSPLLSLWSFETIDRWPTFCLLAVVPLCVTYSSCITAQNQGLKRFKAVALSNVIGAIAGLVVAVPLIIWLRIDSIVWIIVVYGITAWLGAFLFRPRIPSVDMPRLEIVSRGSAFIRLGAQITLAMFITQAFNYIFVLFLNTFASVDTLGIYQSGYTLMNSYVGIIFTALWMEYYPRMASLAHSPKRLSIAASHEARVTLSLLTPLLCLFILLINPILRLIYSDQFLGAVPYVVVGCIGIVFRVTSFCLAYVILAKGDGKTYLTTEITSVLVGFSLNMAGYFYCGFLGLGIAYVLWYTAYTAIVAYMCHRKYGITYSPRTWTFAAVSFGIVTTVALLYLFLIN